MPFEYKFLALPGNPSLNNLWDLKNFFKLNGYSLGELEKSSEPHIALAVAETDNEDLIKKALNKSEIVLKHFHPFEINPIKLTKEPRFHENVITSYWIAYLFNSPTLYLLSDKLIDLFENLKISETYNYVTGIKDADPESADRRVIGDHMNICNKCKPEHVDFVYEKIEKEATKKITISKIILQKNKETIWEFDI